MSRLEQERKIITTLPAAGPAPLEISPTVTYLASLMDDAFRIPGTNFRVGLDGLIGLIPGIGDVAGILVGGIFLQEARRLGVSRWTRTRMVGNYFLDFLVGVVPLVGDLADFAFKANRRNYRLLQEHVEKLRRRTTPP